VQQETAAVFAALALAQQESTAPALTAEPTSTHGRLVSGPR
jgi:mevalonate pyrophosphate decarboxylase